MNFVSKVVESQRFRQFPVFAIYFQIDLPPYKTFLLIQFYDLLKIGVLRNNRRYRFYIQLLDISQRYILYLAYILNCTPCGRVVKTDRPMGGRRAQKPGQTLSKVLTKGDPGGWQCERRGKKTKRVVVEKRKRDIAQLKKNRDRVVWIFNV